MSVSSGADSVTDYATVLMSGDITVRLGCRMVNNGTGNAQFIQGEVLIPNGGDVASDNLYSLGVGGAASTGAYQVSIAPQSTGYAQPIYVGGAVGFGYHEMVTGTMLLRDATHVLTVTFHAIDTPDAGSCQLWGTWFEAPRP